MADVTSEATLKVTTVGADKAAADLRKVQSGLKDVEGQARRTAGSLKTPVGGGGAGSLAAGRAAHPIAALAGDLIGEAMGAMVKAIANPRAKGAVAKAGDAVTKQTIKQGEARAKAVAGSTTRVNSALIKTAGHVANLGKVFDPLVSLLPSAVAGIAGAGTALGILAPAAIAVAGSVFLLTKSFKWISDAADDALDNLGRARRASQGLNIGAEQERLSSAGTSLGIAVGDKFVKPLEASINKLIGDLRTGDIDAKLQEKLNFFGVTLTRLKEFEDKTGRIDFQKVFGLAVGLREELERNIQAAAGDPAKLAKLQENYSKFHSTFEQAFGKEFIDLVDRTSTNMLKAGQAWAAKLDAALGQMPREEVSKNAEEFQLAINRFGSVWTTLRTNIAEGAMPAATAAINAWANVFLEIAPKIQEIGKTLTIGLWQGVEATAGVLRDFVALLPSWETTLKTMGSLWTDFLAEGGRAWDAAENDWKIAVTVITGAISDLKRDFGNMITEVQQTVAWIDGAITAFFTGLKDTIAGFITGLTKSVPGSGINRNAPALNPSDELPGLRKQSSLTTEGDTSISGARIQLAAMTGGSGGSDMNAVIDKALIKVDGNMNALIRNASPGGAGEGPGAGEASITNAALGGTGGFGGGLGGMGGGTGFGGLGGTGGAAGAGAAASAGVSVGRAGKISLGGPTAAGDLSPAQAAFLRTISGKGLEGADYNTIVGGKSFSDFSKHPNVVGLRTALGPSTAAGRYQFTGTTWRRLSAKYGLTDFSPATQDKAALLLAKEDYARRMPGRDLNADIEAASKGDAGAGESLARGLGGRGANTTWQSLQKISGGALAAKMASARTGGPTASLDATGGTVGGVSGTRATLGSITSAIQSSGLHVTQGWRDPNSALGRANPSSAHITGRAFDVRAHTTEQGDAAMAKVRATMAARGLEEGRDYTIKDEVRNPAGWATAKHIHTQLTPEGMAKWAGGDQPITRPQVADNAPAGGMNKSAVAAQGPAEGPGRGSFRGSAEGEAFGKSAAENLRKGLEGTNIPVSGIPPTSKGVAPHVGPKQTGADTATWDV